MSESEYQATLLVYYLSNWVGVFLKTPVVWMCHFQQSSLILYITYWTSSLPRTHTKPCLAALPAAPYPAVTHLHPTRKRMERDIGKPPWLDTCCPFPAVRHWQRSQTTSFPIPWTSLVLPLPPVDLLPHTEPQQQLRPKGAASRCCWLREKPFICGRATPSLPQLQRNQALTQVGSTWYKPAAQAVLETEVKVPSQGQLALKCYETQHVNCNKCFSNFRKNQSTLLKFLLASSMLLDTQEMDAYQACLSLCCTFNRCCKATASSHAGTRFLI